MSPHAIFLDGQTLATRPVALMREGERLVLHGADFRKDYPLQAVRVGDRLGRLPRYLYLPDGATAVTDDHPGVDSLLPPRIGGRFAGLVHRLESHPRIAAIATVLLVAAVVVLLTRGLPAGARQIAHRVPAALDRQAGETALAAFSRFSAPSRLPRSRVRQISTLAGEIARARGLPPPRMEFRWMGGKSPNAFALPGGIIVLTDELCELAPTDDELRAVLAHELGHIHHRHGLQSVLRGSAALLIVTLVTGDLSTLTTFSASIPFLLLQRGYSREFEREADEFAVETLSQLGIDGGAFIAVLQKLEKSHPAEARQLGYTLTHPLTEERVRQIANDPRSVPRSPRAAPTVTPTAAPTAALPVSHPVAPAAAAGAPPQPAVPSRAAVALPPLVRTERSSRDASVKFYAPPSTNSTNQPPAVISQVHPVYPFGMRQAGIEGVVLVQFIVDRDGKVVAGEVLQSDHPAFDAPALAAVAQWTFRPGMVDGRPVNTRLRVPIHFQMQDANDTRLLPVELPEENLAPSLGGPPQPPPGG